jgi:hypothetical protein
LSQGTLEERVARAAERALADHHYVSPLDILAGIGWLSPNAERVWRIGRVEFVLEGAQVGADKLLQAIAILQKWAVARGLQPMPGNYSRASRSGTAELRFVQEIDPEIDKVLRTHYVSPLLPERKRQAMEKKPQPVVFQIVRDSKCSECGVEVEEGDLLFLDGKQPLCLACAGMDELEFLGAGDAAMTRRSTKYSSRSAVVVRFSRSRGRYERQGILVEPAAIAKAEQECAGDAEERARARERGAVARVKEDRELAERMTQEILALYPKCPPEEAHLIAEHTARRGSGRVGRSAAGRALKEDALVLAVRAAIRHRKTDYDELLARGVDREDARARVLDRVEEILDRWSR